MKRWILFVCFLVLPKPSIFNLEPLHAAYQYCSYQADGSLKAKHPILKKTICKLKELPESNCLIEEALKGGSIDVSLANQGMPFSAMWNSGERKIVVDAKTGDDQGEVLVNLLFELTNAVSEPEYQALYKAAQNGRINCDEYVETVERIEHDNMIDTVNILTKGVHAGIFPKSAQWSIIYNFSTHYKIQQLTGHSLFIVKEYHDVSPHGSHNCYRGTVKNLKKMSRSEKVYLAEFLYSDYFRSTHGLEYRKNNKV